MSENTRSESFNIISQIAKIYDIDPSLALDLIYIIAQINQEEDQTTRLKLLKSLEHLIKAIQV